MKDKYGTSVSHSAYTSCLLLSISDLIQTLECLISSVFIKTSLKLAVNNTLQLQDAKRKKS